MTTAPEAGQYDSPWKEALEEAFPEFVAFYFPDAHRQIDWSREHLFLDKEPRQVVRDAELADANPFALSTSTSLSTGLSKGTGRASTSSARAVLGYGADKTRPRTGSLGGPLAATRDANHVESG